MPDTVEHYNGTGVLICAPDGPTLRTDRDALEVVVAAIELGATWAAIPASRLDDDFFQLRTGVAGEIVQRFVLYRRRVAIVGDISRHTSASPTFRDFVLETNRGNEIWFVPDLEQLRARLERLS